MLMVRSHDTLEGMRKRLPLGEFAYDTPQKFWNSLRLLRASMNLQSLNLACMKVHLLEKGLLQGVERHGLY